jgi:hypothetical protein
LDKTFSSPNGLSKNQIRRLFHGHVNTDRIDAALEQLLALDAVNCHSEPTAETGAYEEERAGEEEGDL